MGQKVQGSSFSSTARDAPELAALQGLVAASSGVCCVAAASSHTPELAALQQQASRNKLRSQAPELAAIVALQQSNATQASEPGSGACYVVRK
jgi:hypothetical protein